jgi:hypothetical protein
MAIKSCLAARSAIMEEPDQPQIGGATKMVVTSIFVNASYSQHHLDSDDKGDVITKLTEPNAFFDNGVERHINDFECLGSL